MKKLNILTVLLFLYLVTTAQSIWENPINSGTISSTTNPYTTGDVVATGVTVSGIGASSAISVVTSINRYNASSWASTFDSDEYFTFTLTPDMSQFIHFENFNFSYQKSNTGPANYRLRSSADNFTSDIASNSLSSSGNFIIPLSHSVFGNINTPIEFRLYAWGSTSGSGTFSINDFQFKGTVSNTILPVIFDAIKAIREGGRLSIQWTTFQETNNDHYEIQLSRNGVDFKTIKTVQSKNGNSEIPQHYNASISMGEAIVFLSMPLFFIVLFYPLRKRSLLPVLFIIIILSSVGIASCTKNNVDLQQAENNQLFVRIKQVDKDGSQTFSKVVKVINR